MDAAATGLLGAAIGGGVAILVSLINGLNQRKLEKAKVEWSRENTVGAELRMHVATTARELLAAQHSMEWLCSQTDQDSQLSATDVSNYHTEIHVTFPRLLGALAAVSSLNDQAHKDLLVLADKIFVIDGAIAKALRGFGTSLKSQRDASLSVAEQRKAATALYKELPVSIGRIMKDLRQLE